MDNSTFGERVSDAIASGMGSWTFIIAQTIFVALWMTVNSIHGWNLMWDGYPFILLNLLFSTQAAYAAPIIMMSQNRAADRDRANAAADHQTTLEAEQRIEALQRDIARLETEKLDEILKKLS